MVRAAQPPPLLGPDRAADEAAVATLHEALVTTARLLAPAAPFLADWLHRSLLGTSVHLERFPHDQGRREPELLAAMAAVSRRFHRVSSSRSWVESWSSTMDSASVSLAGAAPVLVNWLTWPAYCLIYSQPFSSPRICRMVARAV